MSHKEQQKFFEDRARQFAEAFASASKILEVGSKNINGTVREYFPAAATYLGIDIGEGKDVDLLVPGELLQLPTGWADIAISTECFEHARTWVEIFKNMIRITREGGLILLTFAGPGRPAHGTLDSDSYCSPSTNDYYRNLGPGDLHKAIPLDHYFSNYAIEVNKAFFDTYFWGIRTAISDDAVNDPADLEQQLSRARGQLGQACERLSIVTRERDKAAAEAYRANVELRVERTKISRHTVALFRKLAALLKL